MLENGKTALAESSVPPSTKEPEENCPSFSQSGTGSTGCRTHSVYEQLNQALAEIRHCREEIRRMASHLVMVRDEERKRIAGEIHDELGQTIAVGKVQLSLLKRGAARTQPRICEQIDSVSELFSCMSESVRRISKNLHPLLLEESGLEAAMESFATDYQKRTGIKCSLHLDELEPFAVETSWTIFRIFQEALTNVVRHAGASRVQISLSRCNRGVVLEIVDDGKGLQPECRSGEGRGLLGIRERVMARGGQMSLSSLAGAGTSLLVLLPVDFDGV